MITVGITKKVSTGEYRVFWKAWGKDIEDKAYYTPDAEDAVFTLMATLESTLDLGLPIKMTDARYTIDLVARYDPGYLIAEAQKAIQAVVEKEV